MKSLPKAKISPTETNISLHLIQATAHLLIKQKNHFPFNQFLSHPCFRCLYKTPHMVMLNFMASA